ncbi:MAG: hypothetical protein VW078_05950 [Flavobacteriales bacterium]
MKKDSFVRLTLIAILLIQIVVILNIRPWKNAEKQNALINWDVTSYYSYLPAIFVHQDLKFNFLKNSTINYAEKHQFWPETAPNGNKVIKTTMGMSVLYLPFFLVAHAFAIFSPEFNANGFSKVYEIGLTFSCVFYLIIGMYFLSKILLRLYDKKIVSILLSLVFLGSNLFFYSTTEPCMSHAYTFSLGSILMYLTTKIFEKFELKTALLFGVILGLLFLVRPTNIIFGLVCFLFNVFSWKSLKKRLVWSLENSKLLALTILVALAVCSVQFIYWKWATGDWIFNSYVGERFYFDRPRILNFLFSYRKGWLVYSPIFILSFLGLFKMYKNKNEWGLPVVITLITTIYLFSCWWCWWFGGGFGMRPMIDYYPLLIIPIGELLKQKLTLLKNGVLTFILLCISFNLFQTLQRRNLVIHWDSMSKESYWAFFTKIKMEKKEDWERQENLLIKPDYDKARIGESEYDFEILQ